MKRMHLRRLAGAVLAAGLLPAALVPAQESDAGRSEQLALDEIIVTARKVEERLVDVPLAITAITAEQIEERGIRNLDDVAANTPGLQFSNLIGEFLPVPIIRGVAPVNIFGENNAAVFVDGVYVAGREGINFSQLDIERIDIVKGPQAALFGRNAFSGAINYVTRKPTDEFRANTEVTVGNDGKLLASVAASGPLVPGKVRGRIAAMYDDWDGSYENQWSGSGPGPDIGGYQYRTFQGSLYFTPNDSVEIGVGAYVSDDQIDTSALSAVVANCEDRNAVNPMLSSRLLNFCGEFPSAGERGLAAIPGATGEDRDLVRGYGTLRWQVGGGELTALSGYSKVQQSFFVDGGRGALDPYPFTYLAAPIVPVQPFGPFGPTFQGGTRRQFSTHLLQIGGGDQSEEFSQELRFASDREQRFRYSVGAYFYSTTRKAGEDGVIARSGLPADFGGFCLACAPNPMNPAIFYDPAFGAGNAAFLEWFTDPQGGSRSVTVLEFETEAPSVFAQAELDLAQRWTATLDARYADEEKRFIDHDSGFEAKDSWGLVNWRATLRFKPRDRMTLYAAVARAEKSGGFDATTVQFVDNPGVNVTLPGAFDPEALLSYELGFKADLLDRRLSIEADVYRLDWSDMVIPQVLSEIDGRPLVQATSFDVNSGEATIDGVELLLTMRPVRGLDVNAGVSWIDAEYDDARIDSFVQFPSYAPLGDVSGNRVLRQSEWQANAGFGYAAQATANVGWFFRTDLAYRGKQYADATNQAIIPDSTILNGSVGLQGERWTVSLWGRNLTDEDAPTGAFRDVYFSNTLPSGTSTGGTFFPFRYSVSHPRLRQYGITWRMRF